jgi:LPXTG-site transpeptidase (sortase) family protein
MVAPAVGIDNAIEEIGITNNQLDTPKDGVGKVGWYYIYDKPGFGKNSVFAAHVNYNFKQGPFANLAKIKAGDQVTIQMEGGPAYTYEVIFYQRYDVNTIPMGELIDAPSRPPGEEWITLITCGGRFQQTQDNGLGEYLDRDVVIAKRVA